MTNGEKIINDFPYIEIKDQNKVFTTIQIDTTGIGIPIIVYTEWWNKWWNAEYKEPTHIANVSEKVDCEHTDCNNCVNHKYCDYESTTNNDLGVENDLVSSIVEKISEKVTETREEFIFETIRPYCENVVQMKISKRDLEQALLKYYGKND